MDLITNVKVSGINSLTDARFYSGAGVRYMGFCFDKNSSRYIETEKVYMIKEWLVGPEFVGEFTANSNPDEINLIVEKAKLDYVQLSEDFSPGINEEIIKPIFQELVIEELSELDSLESRMEARVENVDAFILNFLVHSFPWDIIELDPSNIDLIWKITQEYKVIINTRINKENVLGIIDRTRSFGLNLPAGDEIKTGVQSFDEIADLLELLEKREN